MVALDAWPSVPRCGDLIPAGFSMRNAGGRAVQAARLRGCPLRLLAVAAPDGRSYELIVDARGLVSRVGLMPRSDEEPPS